MLPLVIAPTHAIALPLGTVDLWWFASSLRSHDQIVLNILQRYLGVAHDDTLQRGPHGKPSLAHGDVHFSLSQTASASVLAVSSHAVGIDLECPRILRSPEKLLARFFTAAERAAIAQIPSERRLEKLLRWWTAKEALAKACGRGIALGLKNIAVFLAEDQRITIKQFAGEFGPAQKWHAQHIELPDGHFASVAQSSRIGFINLYCDDDWSNQS
jgi:4'-phosphopantetheinyl transferase